MKANLRVAACAAAALLTWRAPIAAQEGIKGVTTDRRKPLHQYVHSPHERPGVFEAVFTHRFNQAVIDSGGSSLWGLDGSAADRPRHRIRARPNVAVQIYRCPLYADYEFAAEGHALPAYEGPPCLWPSASAAGLDWLSASYLTSLGLQKQSSCFGQVLVSCTLFDRVTIAAAPAYVAAHAGPEGRLERSRDRRRSRSRSPSPSWESSSRSQRPT